MIQFYREFRLDDVARDDDFRIVGARDLEGERAGELAEQRPLDVEHAFGVFDGGAAWGHGEKILVRARDGGME